MDWDFTPRNFMKIYSFANRKGLKPDKLFFNQQTTSFIELHKTIVAAHPTKKIHYRDKSINDILPGLQNKILDIISSCSLKNPDKDSSKAKIQELFASTKKGTGCINDIRYLKKMLISIKEKVVFCELEKYCKSIEIKGIQKWDIILNTLNAKQIISLDKNSLQYFPSRLIQQNLKYAYGIKISNRNQIISQTIELLSDQLPKSIIRADIVDFYNKIQGCKLIEKLEDDKLISVPQIESIKNILEASGKLTSSTGVPRGLGLSAYLAELYLRDFDKQVKELPEVIFYARFVDDIIVIVMENDDQASTVAAAAMVHNKMEKYIEKIGLKLHDSVSSSDKFKIQNHKNLDFNFLGYHFSTIASQNNRPELKLSIAEKKLVRLKTKIDYLFWSFANEKDNNALLPYKKRVKLFHDRLKCLTSLVPLIGIKKNIFVGVPASYPKINDYQCLEQLDDQLTLHLKHFPFELDVKKYGFANSFKHKKAYPGFSQNQMSMITRIWKSI